ncbi:MAG: hypothetical protein R3Y58_07335 [Eubacteriales bacterium]
MADRLTKRRCRENTMWNKASYYTTPDKMDLEIRTIGGNTEMRSPLITRLGEYEDIGSVESIKKKLGFG